MQQQLNEVDLAALKGLAAAFNYAQKNDPVPPQNQGAPFAHGPGGPGALSGIFSQSGVAPDMWGIMPQTYSPTAILAKSTRNPYANPDYDTITGITIADGDPVIDVCSDYPVAGNIKICQQKAAFGILVLQTPTRELNYIGMRVNHGDLDRNLLNQISSANPVIPQIGGGNVNEQLALDMIQIGLGFDLLISRVLFQGDISNGRGGSTFAREGSLLDFDGFDRLIRTGVVDSTTGEDCASMDSVIYDYANQHVGATGVIDIVRLFASVYRQLQQRANMYRMVGARWVIFMHPDLFHRLTELWPCTYLTNQCSMPTDGEVIVNGSDQVAMRDNMRTQNFLWMLGQRVPVVTTFGMTNTALDEGFVSDVYFVNTHAMAQQTTYLEWFDLNNPDLTQYVNALGAVGDVASVNNGMYLVTQERKGACLQYKFETKPRLVTLTPYLNARIENVVYSLLNVAYSRSPFHADEYYVDGGQQFRTAPTQYFTSEETFPHI